jgi:hypothetical protein
MSNHRTTIIGSDARCQARCSCKKQSPVGPRGDVDEWIHRHNEEIQRIRAHLGGRSPSLKKQHEWFIKQAEDPENAPADRELWRQLADEIERHLARNAPLVQEETLF